MFPEFYSFSLLPSVKIPLRPMHPFYELIPRSWRAVAFKQIFYRRKRRAGRGLRAGILSLIFFTEGNEGEEGCILTEQQILSSFSLLPSVKIPPAFSDTTLVLFVIFFKNTKGRKVSRSRNSILVFFAAFC